MTRSINATVYLAILAVWLLSLITPITALPAVPILPYNAPNPKRDAGRTTVVSGLNNWDCRPSAAHPRAIVLVHATLLTEESWHPLVAPALVKNGYCVFALTYGRQPGVPFFGAVNHLESSAREVGDFVNKVLAATNTTQVDMVGHSQGGILGRYWMKYMDGAGKVYRMVGISAITHGTLLSGLVLLGEVTGLLKPAEPLIDAFCAGCYDMIRDSDFMKKLNAGGDTTPGVIHSYIATRYDEVITPYQSTFSLSSGVTNTLVQDLCAVSVPEHLLMVGSKVVMRWILNQLDPPNAKTANCLSVFDWY
ncbi:secreted lipase [Linnemannia elongata]|uniref:Secreted lipase n=1 Tax=Linnemannia elongata AG-77 TaxID=1314771 RepID=A0A197KC55_9FUNG|nr:secreted lipase [Linnemannia elongata]KAK5801898.1 secreted lipase [Linnemannia elongata]OAQ33984.1 secreted lipase [Linnemannia elongata AG-77]